MGRSRSVADIAFLRVSLREGNSTRASVFECKGKRDDEMNLVGRQHPCRARSVRILAMVNGAVCTPHRARYFLDARPLGLIGDTGYSTEGMRVLTACSPP
jgi:hypothetical protein